VNLPAPATGPALRRLPLLALGFVALIVGTLAGLARLGWAMPALAAGAAALHGPLMIVGFFGVVIALERAVAIGRQWAYIAPLAAGLGTIALLLGAPWAAWLHVPARSCSPPRQSTSFCGSVRSSPSRCSQPPSPSSWAACCGQAGAR
jgi:hypothetical protein